VHDRDRRSPAHGAWVEPLRAPFRDAEILEDAAADAKGLAALRGAEDRDGLDLGPDGPDREHLFIEAIKLALADRSVAISAIPTP